MSTLTSAPMWIVERLFKDLIWERAWYVKYSKKPEVIANEGQRKYYEDEAQRLARIADEFLWAFVKNVKAHTRLIQLLCTHNEERKYE
jgi:hypothetical protein